MPSARDDYLMRQLLQVAEAIRRVRERLAGGTSAAETLPELRAAETTLLGTQADLLRRLDIRSAATLLGDPERVRLWADLLRAESEVHRQDGRADAAARAARRSAELGQLMARDGDAGFIPGDTGA